MPITNLCTLEEIKRHLGIDDTAHDALLEDLIAGASGAIESYCRTAFSVEERAEYIDGTGSNDILLAYTPVVEIVDLRVANDHRFESAQPVSEDDLLVCKEWGAVFLKSGVFHRGLRNVRAVYTAGHESVPHEVRSACVRLVASWFNRARQGGDGVAGESFDDYSVRYDAQDFPADVHIALRGYLQPNL